MFDRLQQYLCLMVVIYLLGCLFYDIGVYHGLLAENIARMEIEKQERDVLSHRLDNLIQVIEEEQMVSKRKERLASIKNRLNE